MNASGQRAFGLTDHGRWPGPGAVDLDAAQHDPAPSFFEALDKAPALLVVACETGLIAAMDAELDRHGLVGGASIYPFCWSVLLAARLEGLGGVMTTFAVRREPAILGLLRDPSRRDGRSGGAATCREPRLSRPYRRAGAGRSGPARCRGGRR